MKLLEELVRPQVCKQFMVGTEASPTAYRPPLETAHHSALSILTHNQHLWKELAGLLVGRGKCLLEMDLKENRWISKLLSTAAKPRPITWQPCPRLKFCQCTSVLTYNATCHASVSSFKLQPVPFTPNRI